MRITVLPYSPLLVFFDHRYRSRRINRFRGAWARSPLQFYICQLVLGPDFPDGVCSGNGLRLSNPQRLASEHATSEPILLPSTTLA